MDDTDYIEAYRERWAEGEAFRKAEAERARRVATRLAGLLRERFCVSRVLLVGSLVRGGFRVGSDIDLAVEGLAPADLFRAGAWLEREAEGFRVDLVPLESADPAYRAEAETHGVSLA